jgi:hypothetical protein
MEDFVKWFCLDNRLNFTIDPQINPSDSQYYFGRDDIKERLERQIRRAFIAPGTPKMMVWGPYGSGKTQTLFYLEYFLKSNTPSSAKGIPHTLYLAVEIRSNSDASHLHMQLMEALGKETVSSWVRKLFNENSDFDRALLDLANDDPNIVIALRELRATGESPFAAWRWLSGQSLKPTELSSLQLTRNLGDVGAGDLVNVLVAIGNLAGTVNEQLIFLIDELEELQNVRAGDSAESIHQYVRRIAEPSNSSVGFILGFKADVMDDAPEMLRRGDVQGRIGKSNYLDIPPLPAIGDVQEFMKALLGSLINQDSAQEKITAQGLNTEVEYFPFEKGAFELLADYSTQDITRALPRYIINAINECAIQTWDEELALVNEDVVNQVAPYVFQ